MVVTYEDILVWLRQVEWLHASLVSRTDDARRSNVAEHHSGLVSKLEELSADMQMLSEDLLRAGYSSGKELVDGNLTTFPQLTSREMEAAQHIAKGMTNAQIASAMFIQPQSVKNLIGTVMRKLDCNNRTQVAVRLLEGLGPTKEEQER